MTVLEKLKAAALVASPVDMDLYGDRYSQGCWSHADFDHEQDAFYRLANPTAILDLIAQLKQAQADAERLNYLALNGYAVRCIAKGTKNLLVWGSQYPVKDAESLLDNIRAAIDAAMQGAKP